MLKPLRLDVFDVPADGHCLYAALVHQLGQRAKAKAKAEKEKEGGGGGGGDDTDGDGDDKSSSSGKFDFTVASLRALAASHIREHAPAFEPFIDDEELLEEGGEEKDGDGTNLSKIERYCRRLEGTAAWGGQPELQALASALPATIKVLSAGMDPVVVEGGEGGRGR